MFDSKTNSASSARAVLSSDLNKMPWFASEVISRSSAAAICEPLPVNDDWPVTTRQFDWLQSQ